MEYLALYFFRKQTIYRQKLKLGEVVAPGSSLGTVEDIYPLDSRIFVYPNPTANRIYIQGSNILQTELFDLRGRKLKTTNQKQIDMSEMGIGTFILKVTTESNNIKSFKIIKQ